MARLMEMTSAPLTARFLRHSARSSHSSPNYAPRVKNLSCVNTWKRLSWPHRMLRRFSQDAERPFVPQQRHGHIKTPIDESEPRDPFSPEVQALADNSYRFLSFRDHSAMSFERSTDTLPWMASFIAVRPSSWN